MQVTLQEGNFLIHQNLVNAIVIINSMTTYGSMKLDLSFFFKCRNKRFGET